MEIEILVRNYISESDKFFFFDESYSICSITEIRRRLFMVICSKRVTNYAILGIDGGNA